MALDFCILEIKQYPTSTISISVNDHFQLMQYAKKNDLIFLERIKDYYEDVEYLSNEVHSLKAELESINPIPVNSKLIVELIGICNMAISHNSPINVLAD